VLYKASLIGLPTIDVSSADSRAADHYLAENPDRTVVSTVIDDSDLRIGNRGANGQAVA
jgi:hypothetical protein